MLSLVIPVYRNEGSLPDLLACWCLCHVLFAGAGPQASDADGRIAITGETLDQLLDRVLPLALAGSPSTRVPLYTSTAGWVDLGVRGGFPVSDRWMIEAGAANLLDKNYRIHGSGIDSPGIHVWSALRFTF